MDCSFCNVSEDLPFTCSYCELIFCSSHRLPEKHQCSQLYRVHKPRDSLYQNTNSQFSINNFNNLDSRMNRILNTELRQLLLGMVLVLLVGVSFFLSNNSSYSAITIYISLLADSILCISIFYNSIFRNSYIVVPIHLSHFAVDNLHFGKL